MKQFDSNLLYLAFKFTLFRMSKKLIGFCCFCFLWTTTTIAQVVVLDDKQVSYNLSREVWVFEDSTNSLTINQVRKQGAFFQQHKADAFNFGDKQSDYWLRFQLRNEALNPQRVWLLRIGDPLLDLAELYLPTADQQQYRLKRSGDLVAFVEREVKDRFLVFRLDSLTKHQDFTVYVKISGVGARHFLLTVWNETDYLQFKNAEDVAMGIYVGFLVAIMAYNFFLFFYLRDVSFLIYVPYLGVTLLQQLFVIGWGSAYIFPTNPWLANISANLLIGVSILLGTWFVIPFLNIRQIAPKAMRIIYCLFAIGTLIAIGSAVHYSFFVSKMTDILLLIDILLTFVLGFYLLRTGYPPVRYFMLGWSFMLASVFVASLHNAGVLAGNPLIDTAVFLGNASQALLFSMGLGARFNQMRKDKEQAQLQVVKQLQENDRTRSRIARDLHDDVGSTLSSINILSQVAQNQFDKQPDSVRDLLRRINQNAQRMMDTMGDIVWTTKPDNDNLGSLVVRMKEFGAEVLEAKDIQFIFRVEPTLETLKLPAGRYYDVYLIFKEALNNAAKYAEASEMKIELSQQKECLQMTITDNGQGFDASKTKGNGLKNIQKRAENLKGSLQILSIINEGTQIILTVPFATSLD